MIAPRWRKALRDLWSNKSRTILVVLSIAVGVAAIGMVISTNSIITRQLPAKYAEINPAHARILTTNFDEDLVRVIRGMDSVKEAEGRFKITVRLLVGPDIWRDLELYVIRDFDDIRINKIWPESGAWPPGDEEMLIERAALVLTRARVGDSVLVEAPNGKQRLLKIAGLAYDLNFPAGTFSGQANGYITYETLEALGYPPAYNEMLITVAGNQLFRPYVNQVANEVQSKIEKSGRIVYTTLIPDPGRHWFESYLTPMSLILTVLGVVILLLSGLLVINTISALLAQQVRQVGIMKSVGARTGQIVVLYELMMLVIGLLALAIAVPFSRLATLGVVNIISGIINFDIADKSSPPQVLIIQVILSLFVPMLVAMMPVIRGSRVTVREAISDYGIGDTAYGSGRIDRLLSMLRGIPRPLLLSLRNTFRRKSRLTLTLITLTLGSGIFIAVLNVNAGLSATLDEALGYYDFDVVANFSRPYRSEQVMNVVNQIPGVTLAETWGLTNTRIVNADGSESNSILLVAPPDNSQLIKPVLISGRWLTPEDENAIVINSDVLREKPDLRVGDSVVLNVGGKQRTMQVIGLVRSVLVGPWAYTNYADYSSIQGNYGLASAVYVQAAERDPMSQFNMSRTLEQFLESSGIDVATTSMVAQLRATATQQFSVIVIFLMLMAILLTVVGGFGLTGTMSLNVIERTREIGVMRAIGASDRSVMTILITEGLIIGLISFLLGILVAFPLSRLLSDIVGYNFLNSPLNFTFSISGVIIWLIIVVGLSVLSSYYPARSASRMAVKDVLAYE